MIDANDRAAFDSACGRLVDDFAEWARERTLPIDAWLARVVLEYKWGSVDGHLARWNGEHLADLLLEWLPQRVELGDGAIVEVVPTILALMDFLADSGQMEAGSEPFDKLSAALDELGPEFVEIMDDPARAGLGASLSRAMRADGIDLADGDAVRRWISALNAHPGRQRAWVGWDGTERGDETDLDDLLGAIAPDEELLVEHALASPMLRRLEVVQTFVGSGRALTGAGHLRMRDAIDLVAAAEQAGVPFTDGAADGHPSPRTLARHREVVWTLAWAARLGIIERVGGRLWVADPVPVPGIRLWERGLIAMLEMGLCTAGRPQAASWWPLYDAAANDVLAYLDIEAVPVGELVDVLVADASLTLGRAMSTASLARAAGDAEAIVDRLRFAGLVEDEPGRGRKRRRVRATPLAHWVSPQVLDAHPASLPPIEGSIGLDGDMVVDPAADAARALETLAGRAPSAIIEPLRAWLDRRGPGAVEAVAEVIAARPTPGLVEVAFSVFSMAGVGAEDVVRSLGGVEELAPSVAVWLYEFTTEVAPPLQIDQGAGQVIATMAHLLRSGDVGTGLARLGDLGTLDEVAALVSEWWTIVSPLTEEVLDAIASRHPDRVLAKSARKSLMKLRTARTLV